MAATPREDRVVSVPDFDLAGRTYVVRANSTGAIGPESPDWLRARRLVERAIGTNARMIRSMEVGTGVIRRYEIDGDVLKIHADARTRRDPIPSYVDADVWILALSLAGFEGASRPLNEHEHRVRRARAMLVAEMMTPSDEEFDLNDECPICPAEPLSWTGFERSRIDAWRMSHAMPACLRFGVRVGRDPDTGTNVPLVHLMPRTTRIREGDRSPMTMLRAHQTWEERRR
jgi:hypothetical protein